MRWVAIVVMEALLVSGCASGQDTRAMGQTMRIAGGLGTVVGGSMLLAHAIGPSDSCESDCNDASPVTGGIVLGTGLALLIAGRVVMAVASDQDRDEQARVGQRRREVQRGLEEQRDEQLRVQQERIAHPDDQEQTRRRSLEEAFGLLKTAKEAARSGDCATAVGLGEQIRAVEAVADLHIAHEPPGMNLGVLRSPSAGRSQLVV